MGHQFGTVCHQLCEKAVCLRERSKGAAKDGTTNTISGAGAAGTFCDRGAVYKCSDLLIYTYLQKNKLKNKLKCCGGTASQYY